MIKRLRPLMVALLALTFAPVGGSPATIGALNNCPDVTGDGVVDFNDVDVVFSWAGSFSPPAPPGADVNGDGAIGLTTDVVIVLQALGTKTACQNSPAHGKPPFPGLGDDVMPSLGRFRLLVSPGFRSMMAGYPGYDGVSRLDSPTMSDSATKVGRSAVHTRGSAADTGGTAVGTAGTMISESVFSLIPSGFQGPAGTRELHTELRTMNLTGGGAAVRAGTAAPDRPVSPGEVESYSGSGDPATDWPARSFFDVFVEVDLPPFGGFPGGTIYNRDALLVENISLERFPPKVVYYHGNTSAVPVYFKATNPGFWQAGDLFGQLVLAGHGANFASDSSSAQFFDAAVNNIEQTQGELPPNSCAGAASLVGCWTFDENTGVTASDSSGNGNNGTLVDGPSWATGHSGPAIQFSGSSYVEVPDSLTLDFGTGDFTLAAWINPSGVLPLPYSRTIISKTTLGVSTGYWLGLTSDAHLVLHIIQATGVPVFTGVSTAAVASDGWHHVAVTSQRTGSATFFIDGSPAGTVDISAFGGDTSNSRPFRIGRSETYANQFDGVIDDVKVWSRALSTSEIVAEADADGDGCRDAEELLLVPPTDPHNPWDFYSVPVPALYAAPDPLVVFRDSVVAAGDAQAVFAYFKVAAKTGSTEYEQDLNANGVKDGREYDRSFAGPGMSGPPDGVVTAADAQLAFAQFKFGYHC